MNDIEKQILETWGIHHRITCFMLDHIPHEALAATLSKRGGKNIARQLSHMQNVRAQRLKSYARKNEEDLQIFDPKESPSKEQLVSALTSSGELMSKYILYNLGNAGQVSNFRRGVVPMIGYYISHECHHRGSILLTMKMSGYSLPDELRWKIWEWNKI